MAESDNKPKPTAAEVAAQLVMTDIALIQTLEKAVTMTTALLAGTQDRREQLVTALADGEALPALRAENERLVAENARLQGELDLLRPPLVEEPEAETPVATAEAESDAPADVPAAVEEIVALPTAPIW